MNVCVFLCMFVSAVCVSNELELSFRMLTVNKRGAMRELDYRE